MKSIKIIKTVRDTQTGELLSPPNIVEREDKRAQAFVNGGFAAYVKTAPSPKKAEPTVSEPKKEEPKKEEPKKEEPKKEEPKKEEPKKETKSPSKKRKRTSVTSSPSPKIKK